MFMKVLPVLSSTCMTVVLSSRESQDGLPLSSSCILPYVYFSKFESSTVIPARYKKELYITSA